MGQRQRAQSQTEHHPAQTVPLYGNSIVPVKSCYSNGTTVEIQLELSVTRWHKRLHHEGKLDSLYGVNAPTGGIETSGPADTTYKDVKFKMAGTLVLGSFETVSFTSPCQGNNLDAAEMLLAPSRDTGMEWKDRPGSETTLAGSRVEIVQYVACIKPSHIGTGTVD